MEHGRAVVADPETLIRGEIDLITQQLHVTIAEDEVYTRWRALPKPDDVDVTPGVSRTGEPVRDPAVDVPVVAFQAAVVVGAVRSRVVHRRDEGFFPRKKDVALAVGNLAEPRSARPTRR